MLKFCLYEQKHLMILNLKNNVISVEYKNQNELNNLSNVLNLFEKKVNGKKKKNFLNIHNKSNQLNQLHIQLNKFLFEVPN